MQLSLFASDRIELTASMCLSGCLPGSGRFMSRETMANIILCQLEIMIDELNSNDAMTVTRFINIANKKQVS